MKRLLRNSVGYLTYFTGLTALVRSAWPCPGALILMFHRVRDDDDAYLPGMKSKQFDQLVRYLKRYYHPLSLSDLVTHVQKSQPLPDNSVVLTFDDGFRDNYDNAFPVLQKYQVPATIFLVTNSIETGALPWPQQIGYILQHTARREVVLKEPIGVRFSLRTQRERRQAFHYILNLRRSLAQEQLAHLAQQLSCGCDVVPPLDRMLTWSQIREMSRQRIEFGAHTVTHPLMEYVPLEEAKGQLIESKNTIEARLGCRVRHFCFPAGSLNDPLIELAKGAGFESLFRPSRRQYVNTHLTNPHALRRWGAYDPVPTMAAELAGILELVRFRWRTS